MPPSGGVLALTLQPVPNLVEIALKLRVRFEAFAFAFRSTVRG